MRNSTLPDPPLTGEGMAPATRQPGLRGEPCGDRLQRTIARAGIAHDAALADALWAHLELRLDERNEERAGSGKLQRRSQRLDQGDEADVGGDGANRLGHRLARQPPCVEPFERHDARVGLQAGVQLAVADVGRINLCRAAIEQHLREAAGRGADIESDAARGIELEGGKCGGELLPAARYRAARRRDRRATTPPSRRPRSRPWCKRRHRRARAPSE